MSLLVYVQKCVCKILDCGLLLICTHAVSFSIVCGIYQIESSS